MPSCIKNEKTKNKQGLARVKMRLIGHKINNRFLGSGCGSVDRQVASNTRGPQFKSSHRQDFLMTKFINNC